MNFILSEDNLVQNLAKMGYKFFRVNLRMEDIYCYWINLLIQYSKLLKFQPKLDKSLKKIS